MMCWQPTSHDPQGKKWDHIDQDAQVVELRENLDSGRVVGRPEMPLSGVHPIPAVVKPVSSFS